MYRMLCWRPVQLLRHGEHFFLLNLLNFSLRTFQNVYVNAFPLASFYDFKLNCFILYFFPPDNIISPTPNCNQLITHPDTLLLFSCSCCATDCLSINPNKKRNMGRPVSGTHHHHNVVGRLQAIPHLHELCLDHRSSLVV